jgi:hypothetical protein
MIDNPKPSMLKVLILTFIKIYRLTHFSEVVLLLLSYILAQCSLRLPFTEIKYAFPEMLVLLMAT